MLTHHCGASRLDSSLHHHRNECDGNDDAKHQRHGSECKQVNDVGSCHGGNPRWWWGAEAPRLC